MRSVTDLFKALIKLNVACGDEIKSLVQPH
jgi:hypothetical protein